MTDVKRGDRIRQLHWTNCYLFVTKVTSTHIHGRVYDPTNDNHLCEIGIWSVSEEWRFWVDPAFKLRQR